MIHKPDYAFSLSARVHQYGVFDCTHSGCRDVLPGEREYPKRSFPTPSGRPCAGRGATGLPRAAFGHQPHSWRTTMAHGIVLSPGIHLPVQNTQRQMPSVLMNRCTNSDISRHQDVADFCFARRRRAHHCKPRQDRKRRRHDGVRRMTISTSTKVTTCVFG